LRHHLLRRHLRLHHHPFRHWQGRMGQGVNS
jgi:hypothetical protein